MGLRLTGALLPCRCYFFGLCCCNGRRAVTAALNVKYQDVRYIILLWRSSTVRFAGRASAVRMFLNNGG